MKESESTDKNKKTKLIKVKYGANRNIKDCL